MAAFTSKQNWLFPPEKPLKDRFAPEFFQSIPKNPGVYFLRDAEGKTLYVGQSRNLRQRILSYKNAHPNHSPRRTLRLIRLVRSIDWETCDSALAAILREDELLRTLKPQFNRANVYPEGYRYLKILSGKSSLTIQEQAKLPNSSIGFGAFKGSHTRALAALGRVLFRIQNGKPHWWQIPSHLLRPTRKLKIDLDPSPYQELPEHFRKTVIEYLSGTSRLLVDVLLEASVIFSDMSPFDTDFLTNDLLEVDHFFTANTQRNWQLCRMAQKQGSLVDAMELNALLIQARNLA